MGKWWGILNIYIYTTRTDMRVLDVLDKVTEAGERDSAAVELADVDQEHGHSRVRDDDTSCPCVRI